MFPHRRDRLIETQEIREGLIDLLQLEECGILPLIAERNSSLGKVYAPSQKMLYELKFFVQIRDCHTQLQNKPSADPELLSLISQIYRIKKDNLAAEIWNGIYVSSEVEANFSRGEPPLDRIDDGSAANMLSNFTAIAQLSELLIDQNQWALPDKVNSIETLYEPLHRNRSGAKALKSILLLTHSMNEATQIIETRLKKRALCFNQKPSAKAQILKNVFYKFYIGEFQPYLAQSHRHAKNWIELNNLLFLNFEQAGLNVPKAMETYQLLVLSETAEGSLWFRYQSARKKHTQAWQKILKQCRMMPTNRD
ncbi:DUF3080 family protein [Neptuniibacter sp.]|uniref:DUF3080 family protein n=1 Tax=Neptuniibacter sp. TaxID=1962643 RepID=UPI002624D332|nr:DUF3080 family protein [Neptuniibacter sp.]MCP4598187.1 DUF3080 domain-containing protein [Neptuniibacter sp.]